MYIDFSEHANAREKQNYIYDWKIENSRIYKNFENKNSILTRENNSWRWLDDNRFQKKSRKFLHINILHVFSLHVIFIIFSIFPDITRKLLIFKILISMRYIQSQTPEIHNWVMQERWVSYFRLDPWDCMEITWNFSGSAPRVCFLSANVIKIY